MSRPIRFLVPARLPREAQRDFLARLEQHDPEQVALLRDELVSELRQVLGAQVLIEAHHPAVRDWLAADPGNRELAQRARAVTDGRRP